MQKANTDAKEKAGKKVKKKLLNNIGLKLMSILIAVVLWFTVVIINNPKDSRTFANIPVTLVNTHLLEEEGKVFEILDNSNVVRVTVEVPKNDLNLLQSGDIIAEADVANLTAVNTVPISCKVQNERVSVVGITLNHDVVRLSVEDEARNWVNIQYNTVGEPAEGFMVSSVSGDSTRLQVIGPKSQVDLIDHAYVELDVSNATSTQSLNTEPIFVDADGNRLEEVSRVTSNTKEIHVIATILAVKEVPIELNVKGAPAEGYLKTGVVECEPETVRICGTVAALSGVSKISIPGEELDISGATKTVESTINIRKYLPENVMFADSGFIARVSVTVHIEEERSRTLMIPKNNFTVVGMPENLEWEYADGELPFEARVSGLNARISSIDQNTVKGTVNIGDWMQKENIGELNPGTYRVPVEIVLPYDVELDSQSFVRIMILEMEEEE